MPESSQQHSQHQPISPAPDSLAEELKQSSLPTAWRSDAEQRMIDIVDVAKESVVFITTETQQPIAQDLRTGKIWTKPMPAGLGSGVIVDAKKGIVLTNYHVVEGVFEGNDSLSITMSDNQKLEARVLGGDKDLDLAVVKINNPPSDLKARPLGSSSNLVQAQAVIAIGNPFGLEDTVTSGLISSLERPKELADGRVIHMIQTDASINPGNSGGPLLDMDGRVIGLNTMIFSKSGTSSGLGFAIPVDAIKDVLREAIDKGMLRPSLGIRMTDTSKGPVVVDVEPHGVAEEAGIRGIPGKGPMALQSFFLKKVNGVEVRNTQEAIAEIFKVEEGKPLSLTFSVMGKEQSYILTPR